MKSLMNHLSGDNSALFVSVLISNLTMNQRDMLYKEQSKEIIRQLCGVNELILLLSEYLSGLLTGLNGRSPEDMQARAIEIAEQFNIETYLSEALSFAIRDYPKWNRNKD